MRKVYTIGETVYDIIFKNDKQVSAKPGGAMLNTAVSLGRLGLPVSFISELAKDEAGKLILDFLKSNNVQTDSIYKFVQGKTAIAHAMLDEQDNATYTFYKNYPETRMVQKMPFVTSDDIVVFGSFFAITKEVRKPLVEFIHQSMQKDATIIYDPNFRKPHLHELPKIKDDILENISYSSIVRGSDEDFMLIFNTDNADETFQIIRECGCPNLIYTASDKSVEFRSAKISFSLLVPPIKTVSTIGAGDTFNAGIIYNLIKLGISKNDLVDLKQEVWEDIIQNTIEFGSHVCTHFDNYVTSEFADQVRKQVKG